VTKRATIIIGWRVLRREIAASLSDLGRRQVATVQPQDLRGNPG